MRPLFRVRHSGASAVLALGLLLLILAVLPTPYWIITPGSALDLRTCVQVEGHAPGRDRYFLTDVNVRQASVLLLLARYIPGVRLVPQEELIPKGVALTSYDRLLVQAMGDGQNIAAFVAERAAGLPLADPPTSVSVAAILPASHARNVVHVGDILVRVAGRRLDEAGDVSTALGRLPPGALVPLVFQHAGRTEYREIPTMRTATGARLGIVVRTNAEPARLVVPVRFSLANVSGSSGGLMLALQVYGALHPDLRRVSRRIAGTGTLSYDGSVSAIEGVGQKVIAAKRAGASVFFVPWENYGEIAQEHEIRVIPVRSFHDALTKLARL
jgi:Lon-like protease